MLLVESVGEIWLLFGELCQKESSFWERTKPPDEAKPAQTPTDILQFDITPGYYIHHSLSSLCSQMMVRKMLQCFRSMFNSRAVQCAAVQSATLSNFTQTEGDTAGRKSLPPSPPTVP